MKSRISIAIALCLFACSEEQVSPLSSTVHLAGFVANAAGGGVASYWKDSVYTALVNGKDGEISSQVSSLYVDGSSVLIGGSKFVPKAQIPALIWRDGTETVIEGAFGNPMIASRNNNLFGVWPDATGWVFHRNGTSQPISDTAYTYAPMAMAVQGADVYASGYSSVPALPPTYSPPQHAQYWKNGQLIFRESEVSNALSIFIYQDDIYMAGLLYSPGGLTSIACYWKNGQRVNLTDGNGTAIARSIFVTDRHVYVAGMINDQSVYWKDGDAIFMTTGTYSMANSIFVQGNDVHVAGYEHGHPAYWKNNVRQDIDNQDKLGQVLFVVVGSN